jgi:DNA-directed RNA polymerase subunit RPC12/RpoP
MLVCNDCSREMRCVKTGMHIILEDMHTTYRGDTFQCMKCGHKITNARDQNQHHEEPVVRELCDVILEESNA